MIPGKLKDLIPQGKYKQTEKEKYISTIGITFAKFYYQILRKSRNKMGLTLNCLGRNASYVSRLCSSSVILKAMTKFVRERKVIAK